MVIFLSRWTTPRHLSTITAHFLVHIHRGKLYFFVQTRDMHYDLFKHECWFFSSKWSASKRRSRNEVVSSPYLTDHTRHWPLPLVQQMTKCWYPNYVHKETLGFYQTIFLILLYETSFYQYRKRTRMVYANGLRKLHNQLLSSLRLLLHNELTSRERERVNEIRNSTPIEISRINLLNTSTCKQSFGF